MKIEEDTIVHCKITKVEFVSARDSLQGVPFAYVTLEVIEGALEGMTHTFTVEGDFE